MGNLIAASESFYDTSKKEEVSVDLFNSFMRHITVWDYAFITSEYYLSLQNHEKEVMIKKYYFDMRSRTCGKILLFLLRLKLFEAVWNDFCLYCKDCKKCENVYSIRSEFKKKDFSTFNKGIKYWDVRDHEQFEIRPIRDQRFRM